MFPSAFPLPGEPAVEKFSAEAYARTLKQLLPQGSLWNLEADSKLSAALLAIGEELARVGQRGADLIEESDPRTALETLGEWEAMLGLPDTAILTIPATTAARRLAITQKFVATGGQSSAYFTALAAACGYTVTLSNYKLARSGLFRAGHYLHGYDYGYAMLVKVTATAADALTHAELEAVIRRVTHAHITVVFAY